VEDSKLIRNSPRVSLRLSDFAVEMDTEPLETHISEPDTAVLEKLYDAESEMILKTSGQC
jgi:hypothetical protein